MAAAAEGRQRPPGPESRGGLAAALFLATFVSAALSQTALADEEALARLPQLLWAQPQRLGPGLQFAAALMLILVAHELGHSWVAHRYGVSHGWPLFVPAPTVFGTLGAIMPMTSPAPHRPALARIAAMGPLCGLAVALPLYLWGLGHPAPAGALAPPVGASLLTQALGALLGAGPAPSPLSPVALAGWLGLFLTGLNLTPMGHLDGGHLLYALTPRGHRWASLGCAALLGALGAAGTAGLLGGRPAPSSGVWALLALGTALFGLRHDGVADGGQKPLGPTERALGGLALVLWLCTAVVVPMLPA